MRIIIPACLALAVVLGGCGATTPVVISSPVPAQPVVPAAQVLSISEKVLLVSDALRNTLPALGIDSPKLTQGLEIIDQLTAVANLIPKSSGGVDLGKLVLQASDLIQMFGPVVGLVAGEYAPVISAATALLPSILELAGITPTQARMARVSMSPDQAEAILRTAARR